MKQKIVLIMTLMLAGRAMTLAFIHRAGGNMPGDPPVAWLMPLIGDAVIGISALWIAWLLLFKTGLWVWQAVIVWNALAIWDAMSAYIVHLTNPWPTFFMIEWFGASMFFVASAMHAAIIVLVCRRELKAQLIGDA